MPLFKRRGAEGEFESAPVPIADGTLLNIGEMAVGATSDEFFHEIDGVRKELTVFQNAWDSVNDTVSDFLDDEVNQQNFDTAIHEYRNLSSSSTPHCPHRVLGLKLNPRDMTEFVTAKLLQTQATSMNSKLDFAGRQTTSIRDTFTHTKKVDVISKGIDTKWSFLRDSACVHAPKTKVFYNSLEKLASQVDPHYNDANKHAAKVLRKLHKYLSDDPSKAMQVFDALDTLITSTDPSHQTLLRIIATDHVHYADEQNISLIEHAVQSVESAIAGGGVVATFLKEKAQTDASHWVHYIHRTYQRLNGKQDFFAYMQKDLENWPNSWQEEYRVYAKEVVSLLRIRSRRDMQKYVDKQLIRPTLYEADVAIDRLIKKMGAKPESRAQKTKYDEATVRGTYNLSRVLPPERVSSEETSKKLQPVFLVRGRLENKGSESFFETNDYDIQQYVQDIAQAQQQNGRYTSDLMAMVKRISEQPFGTGTTRLEGKMIALDGKRLKVRRLNPNHAVGLSVPAAKDSRIIFSVSGNKLGIISICPNHDEYDKFIKTL